MLENNKIEVAVQTLSIQQVSEAVIGGANQTAQCFSTVAGNQTNADSYQHAVGIDHYLIFH